MTVVQLLTRVRERGGELRLLGPRLQYRPAKALTREELGWVKTHRWDVISVLAGPDPGDRRAFEEWLPTRFGVDCVHIGYVADDTPVWLPLAAWSRP